MPQPKDSQSPGDAQSELNPFSPPTTIDEETHSLASTNKDGSHTPRSVGQSFATWLVVCSVSAIPSLFWGSQLVSPAGGAAMILGIAIFVAIYTIADQLTQTQAWRQPKLSRLVLKIGYGTRIAISIIFPVGGLIDMFCGIFAISFVRVILPEEMVSNSGSAGNDLSFPAALLITLVQGCILNLVLGGYMLLIWTAAILARGSRGIR